MLASALIVLSALPPVPEVPREFRGVWVATVDNIDWPSKKTLTTPQQQEELKRIVDLAARLRLNAIVFQVRPSADALYASRFEPWSEYLTGACGKAPDPLWDPLKFIVEAAHDRGIEVHAWFNPYRAWHPAAKGEPSPDHITQTHPESAPAYGRYRWMDPSDPFVQRRSRDVMLDVVRRYDVDGIHIDDYFYPYPITEGGKKVDFPDQANFDAYVASGGTLSRGDWRRKQVDDFVRDVYRSIKQTKKWVKFGISPFGIYRPGHPPSISAGIDQYEALYADCKKWLEEGWCDYMAPQLYWPIAQTKQSYPVLLEWWTQNNPKKRHIWPGSFTSQVGSSASWPVEEIPKQIEIARKTPGAGGHIHFSMKAMLRNQGGLNDVLLKGVYSTLALPPASPWLASQAPPAIRVKSARVVQGRGTVALAKAPAGALFWAVGTGTGKKARLLAVTSAKRLEVGFPAPDGSGSAVQSMWAAAIDHAGRMGAPATIKPRTK